jgi:hypothetical protein
MYTNISDLLTNKGAQKSVIKTFLKEREAGLDTAMLLATLCFYNHKDKCGLSYNLHCLSVGYNAYTRSGRDISVFTAGVLHDIVEDTKWTLDDLKDIAFTDRVVRAVESVTCREDEKYFDFIERCSTNPDGVHIKICDLEDNARTDRYPKLPSEKDSLRLRKYLVSMQYLKAVEAKIIQPATPMREFISLPHYAGFHDPDLLQKYSSSSAVPESDVESVLAKDFSGASSVPVVQIAISSGARKFSLSDVFQKLGRFFGVRPTLPSSSHPSLIKD